MPGNIATLLGERMGNAGARVKFGSRKAPWRRGQKSPEAEDKPAQMVDSEEGKFANADSDAERDELLALRRLVREKPDVFILNNLIMSIQLFAHYEKEIETARKKVMTRESEMNENLLPEKMALMPNVLQEHCDGRLRFTSFYKSEEDEQRVEPLKPIQIYLVYENVLITELEETRHYSCPGDLAVDYTFVLKQADHKGYVRLAQLNKPSLKRSPGSDNTDLSSIVENQDEIYSEDESVYGPVNSQRQNGNAAVATTSSMPDLLDEEIYYDEENSSSTQDLQSNSNSSPLSKNSRIVGVHNVRIPSRISRPQRNARLRPGSAVCSTLTKPRSASSSSSGYTTNYGLDSDSDSSGLASSGGRTHSRNGRRLFIRHNNLDPNEIPDSCFKCITYTFNDRIYNPRREQKPLTSQQRRIREAKIAKNYKVVYVSGYRFAKNFFEVFRDHLAERMDFDEDVVKSAKRCDGTIHLEKIDYLSANKYISIEQYEVIPCLSSPWPKWARMWLERQRGDWPNHEDVRRVEKFGCYLVPETAQPPTEEKRANAQPHPLWKLDWRLAYPAAERYLETCLSATQMTVYAIALMVHKTFVRTASTSFGLNPGHVRNMLFWMVEKQPDWSEHEMGKFLLNLLESLHNRIQQRMMCDYFMHDRNLFATITSDHLLPSQKQLQRLIENPVMFIFHAMEKIHYENDDYPRLDYQELLRLLTINELVLINPNLVEAAAAEELPAAAYGKRETEKKFWSEAKQANQYYMQKRKRNMKTLINPQMEDGIIYIQEKCEPLTSARLALLMIFFSEHFLKMARCCHRLGAARQKIAYLDQTRLLALLLSENPDYEHTAQRLLNEVRELRNDIEGPPPPQPPSKENGAPETPMRNSDAPIFTRTLRDRFGGLYTYPTTTSEENESSEHVVAEVNVHAIQEEKEEGTAATKSTLYRLTSNSSSSSSKGTRFIKRTEKSVEQSRSNAETTSF